MMFRQSLAVVAAALLLTITPAQAQRGSAFLGETGGFVGEVRAFAISEANGASLTRLYNAGWVPADGRSLPRTSYPELFRALGTTWGAAADQASFLVPDLRGVFLRGYTGGSNRDPDAAGRSASANGGATGNRVGSYQDDALQAHKHPDAGHRHALQQQAHTGRNYAAGPYDQSLGGARLDSATGYAEIGEPAESPGSGGAPRASTESRPRNVYVYYFVYAGRRVTP